MSEHRISRRQTLRHIAGTALFSPLVLCGSLSKPVRADETIELLYVPDEIDEAVHEAVDFLVRSQRDDGAIQDRGHEIAMTALAIMAMASIGTTPDTTTPHGQAVTKALEFVLDPRNQDSEGYFGRRDSSRMYGHGIITLMLTEMLGMGESVDQNARMHHALELAIELILASQKVTKLPKYAGGWRYTPSSQDSDLSVSVWQLLALRSAKNDGLDVPGEAIDQAIRYLENSFSSPLDANGQPRESISGFSYTPGMRPATFTMTSAGLLAMQACGRYDSPLVAGAAQWLLQRPPKRSERFFFYGIYYYAQGMHQAGGDFAKAAEQLVPALLIDEQNADGSWLGRSSDEQKYGSIYATALAVLSLSVRYHYLPIYQR